MKFSEMNAHEKEACRFVINIMSEMIGGNENQMMDYEEGSEEYEEAKAYLQQPRENLIDDLYTRVMMEADYKMEKHIRFAGTEFIKERISRRLARWGY